MQIRLFIDSPLSVGQTVALPENQVHYLKNVLRADVGAELYVFDGKNGEFAAVLSALGKKTAIFRFAGLCANSPRRATCGCTFPP